MAPEVAVSVVHGRKIVAAKDPKAYKQAALEEMTRGSAPWEAASQGLIDRIIRPQDTRAELIRALERAQGPGGRGGLSQKLLANWPSTF